MSRARAASSICFRQASTRPYDRISRLHAGIDPAPRCEQPSAPAGHALALDLDSDLANFNCYGTSRRISDVVCRGVVRSERDDPLYEAVIEGRRQPGMEHWLPLFTTGWISIRFPSGYSPIATRAAKRGNGPRASSSIRLTTDYEARREALDIRAARDLTSRCHPTGFT